MNKLLGKVLLSFLKRSPSLFESYKEAHEHSLHVANETLTQQNLELEATKAETIEKLLLQNAELERLANTDPHTQISNRRHFDTYLLKEWERGQRNHDQLSLILCDLDHFHAYNEAYGSKNHFQANSFEP